MFSLVYVLIFVLSGQVGFGDSVYLDHVMVEVSPTTYKTISSSTFLRGYFSSHVIDTITATDDAWTGTYLSGEHTYIEFFSSNAPQDSMSSGIAFSVDQSGAVEKLANSLSQVWGEQVQSKLQSGTNMPWYYTVGIDTSGIFSSWVMEYHPEFTEFVRTSKKKAATTHLSEEENFSGLLRREEMMARDFNPDLLLGDLTGVDIALDDPRRSQFIRELQLFGYQLQVDESIVTAVGPDIILRIYPASGGRRGVIAIHMSLLRPPVTDEREHNFGSSVRLVFSNREASWIFGE